MAKRWARDIEKELGSPTVDIDADTKAAEKKIERLEKDKHTTHVDVDVDAAKAEAELDAVTRDRTVKIDVDKSLWSGGFKHLGAEGIPGCAGGWHQQAQSSLPLALPQAHPWAQAWGKHSFPR